MPNPKALAAFDLFVRDLGAWEESPENVKGLCRDFFLAGWALGETALARELRSQLEGGKGDGHNG